MSAPFQKRKIQYKNVSDVIKQGYLKKQGAKFHTWRNRWFVLQKDGYMFYFTKPIPNAISKGGFSITNAKITVLDDVNFDIDTPHRIYHFIATDKQTLEAWNESLKNLLRVLRHAEQGLMTTLDKQVAENKFLTTYLALMSIQIDKELLQIRKKFLESLYVDDLTSGLAYLGKLKKNPEIFEYFDSDNQSIITSLVLNPKYKEYVDQIVEEIRPNIAIEFKKMTLDSLQDPKMFSQTSPFQISSETPIKRTGLPFFYGWVVLKYKAVSYLRWAEVTTSFNFYISKTIHSPVEYVFNLTQTKFANGFSYFIFNDSKIQVEIYGFDTSGTLDSVTPKTQIQIESWNTVFEFCSSSLSSTKGPMNMKFKDSKSQSKTIQSDNHAPTATSSTSPRSSTKSISSSIVGKTLVRKLSLNQLSMANTGKSLTRSAFVKVLQGKRWKTRRIAIHGENEFPKNSFCVFRDSLSKTPEFSCEMSQFGDATCVDKSSIGKDFSIQCTFFVAEDPLFVSFGGEIERADWVSCLQKARDIAIDLSLDSDSS